MKCPKCNTRMKVTHTYVAGTSGRTQRLACPCGLVGTAVAVLVATDPSPGFGAKAMADKIVLSDTPPKVTFSEEKTSPSVV